MIIGFLGKGGSGKSTVSSRFASYLLGQDQKVLAIDADHNMDLMFNLGVEKLPKYLGQSLEDLYQYAKLEPAETYKELFAKDIHIKFTLDNPDSYTEKYAYQVSPGLKVMASGPHTDLVLYGKNCSHSLGTPLKVYLPFLETGSHYVVVDEKAGSDGAGTGIPTGVHLAIINAEPTPHGVKAANQIAELLEFFSTPYEFLINKLMPEDDLTSINNSLRKPAKFTLGFDRNFTRPDLPISQQSNKTLADIKARLDEELGEPDLRLQKTKEKFARNLAFAKSL